MLNVIMLSVIYAECRYAESLTTVQLRLQL
jgi:hypothetical protein